MPQSLGHRLKNLVRKGLLSEKDLERIVIIQIDATNGDVQKALHPKNEVKPYKTMTGDNGIEFHVRNHTSLYREEWWNAKFER